MKPKSRPMIPVGLGNGGWDFLSLHWCFSLQVNWLWTSPRDLKFRWNDNFVILKCGWIIKNPTPIELNEIDSVDLKLFQSVFTGFSLFKPVFGMWPRSNHLKKQVGHHWSTLERSVLSFSGSTARNRRLTAVNPFSWIRFISYLGWNSIYPEVHLSLDHLIHMHHKLWFIIYDSL